MDVIIEKRKIYTYLAMLREEEQAEFMAFLNTIYFNNNPLMSQITMILLHFYPYFNHADLNDEFVIEQLRFAKPKDRKWLQKQYFQLSKLIQTFLQHQTLKARPTTQQQLLLEAYQSRSVAYPQLLEQAFFKPKPTDASSDWSDWLTLWQVHHTIFTAPDADKFGNYRHHFQQAIASLDATYLLLRLRYICEQLFLEVLPADDAVIQLLRHAIQKYLVFDEHPVIRFYWAVLELLTQENPQTPLNDTIKDFKANYAQLPKPDQAALLAAYINLTYRQTLAQIEKRRAIFDLYQLKEKLGLFIINGTISDLTFLNTIVFSVALDIAWAKQFIKNYKAYLLPAIYENAISLAQAYIHFSSGNMSKTEDALLGVNFTNIQYKIRAKSLLVRCYFQQSLQREAGYLEMTYAMIDSFRNFVKRNKQFPPNKRGSYQNMLRAIRLLCNYVSHSGTSRKSPERLRQQIEQLKPIIAKEWVLAALEETLLLKARL